MDEALTAESVILCTFVEWQATKPLGLSKDGEERRRVLAYQEADTLKEERSSVSASVTAS